MRYLALLRSLCEFYAFWKRTDLHDVHSKTLTNIRKIRFVVRSSFALKRLSTYGTLSDYPVVTFRLEWKWKTYLAWIIRIRGLRIAKAISTIGFGELG